MQRSECGFYGRPPPAGGDSVQLLPAERAVGPLRRAAVDPEASDHVTSPKTPVEPPSEASPAGEQNRFLAKHKTSLVRRWSLSRMDTLYDIDALATYLWSLDRADEALPILRSVTSAIPGPPRVQGGVDYNVWSPVSCMYAMQAFLTQDPVVRQPLLDDPALAPNRSYIASQVADAPTVFAKAEEKTTKWACLAIAANLAALVTLSELAAGGHPYAEWYDADEVAARIELGKALLRQRLEAAA